MIILTLTSEQLFLKETLHSKFNVNISKYENITGGKYMSILLE